MIEAYAFGRMTIDGTEYRSDLIIYPNGRVQDDWWRAAGHRLIADDIAELLATKPALLIVGTGAYGIMKVDPALRERLERDQIAFEAARSKAAVALYNENVDKRQTAACFHLTC